MNAYIFIILFGVSASACTSRPASIIPKDQKPGSTTNQSNMSMNDNNMNSAIAEDTVPVVAKPSDPFKELNLSSAQDLEIRAILKDFELRRDAIESGKDPDKLDKLNLIRTNKIRRVFSVLTDQQKQLLILADPEYNDMEPMPKRK